MQLLEPAGGGAAAYDPANPAAPASSDPNATPGPWAPAPEGGSAAPLPQQAPAAPGNGYTSDPVGGANPAPDTPAAPGPAAQPAPADPPPAESGTGGTGSMGSAGAGTPDAAQSGGTGSTGGGGAGVPDSSRTGGGTGAADEGAPDARPSSAGALAVSSFRCELVEPDGQEHHDDSVQVELGKDVKLSWQVSGATRVRIDPAPGELPAEPSSVVITPQADTELSLVAISNEGRYAGPAKVTIGVHPPGSVVSSHAKVEGAENAEGEGEKKEGEGEKKEGGEGEGEKKEGGEGKKEKKGPIEVAWKPALKFQFEDLYENSRFKISGELQIEGSAKPFPDTEGQVKFARVSDPEISQGIEIELSKKWEAGGASLSNNEWLAPLAPIGIEIKGGKFMAGKRAGGPGFKVECSGLGVELSFGEQVRIAGGAPKIEGQFVIFEFEVDDGKIEKLEKFELKLAGSLEWESEPVKLAGFLPFKLALKTALEFKVEPNWEKLAWDEVRKWGEQNFRHFEEWAEKLADQTVELIGFEEILTVGMVAVVALAWYETIVAVEEGEAARRCYDLTQQALRDVADGYVSGLTAMEGLAPAPNTPGRWGYDKGNAEHQRVKKAVTDDLTEIYGSPPDQSLLFQRMQEVIAARKDRLLSRLRADPKTTAVARAMIWNGYGSAHRKSPWTTKYAAYCSIYGQAPSCRPEQDNLLQYFSAAEVEKYKVDGNRWYDS